jgi:hypothetical protein
MLLSKDGSPKQVGTFITSICTTYVYDVFVDDVQLLNSRALFPMQVSSKS